MYRTVLAGLLVAAVRAPADVRLVGIGPSPDGSSSTEHVGYCVGDASGGDRGTQ